MIRFVKTREFSFEIDETLMAVMPFAYATTIKAIKCIVEF